MAMYNEHGNPDRDRFERLWAERLLELPPARRTAEFWTIEETCYVIDKSASRVRQLVTTNGLSVRIGGRIFVDQVALKEFLRRRSDPDAADFRQTG
jgi:hypothetical protein